MAGPRFAEDRHPGHGHLKSRSFMKRYRTPFFAALLLLACLGHGEAARFPVSGPGTDPGSGVDIEVLRFYEDLPRHGFAPLRITITNNSGRERSWRFSFSSASSYDKQDTLSYEATLRVANGDAKRFDVLVPLVRSNDYQQLNMNVRGHGVMGREGAASLQGSFHRTEEALPAIAMSPQLANRNWGDLRDNDAILGSTFDETAMMTDWRAYTGFDMVWLTDEDWNRLGADERGALLDWTALGGSLYVARNEGVDTPLAGLAGLGGEEPIRRGFGLIRRWTREGDALDADQVRREISANLVESKHADLGRAYRRSTWGLLDDIEEVQMRTGLLIGFLLVFAIVIGPVNLFLFARGSRRYHLFWTTPVLSLGASALLLALILFQDGTGGKGRQFAIWSYLPEENKAVFIQEQVARTSLLTGRSFQTETPVNLSLIDLGSHTPLNRSSRKAALRSFAGDWFRNRSLQGHLVEGVAATRSRIERLPEAEGGPPVLLSTFPFPLRAVYYADQDGWWKAENLRPGAAKPLRPSSAADFREALRTAGAPAGPIAARALSRKKDRAVDQFFAFATDADGATEKTLGSIRWQSKSLHTGPVIESQP